MGNQGALALQTAVCRSSFRSAIEGAKSDQSLWIKNRLVDFNMWASGLGAEAPEPASLDYRLRYRPDIAGVIQAHLHHLAITLGACTSSPELGAAQSGNQQRMRRVPQDYHSKRSPGGRSPSADELVERIELNSNRSDSSSSWSPWSDTSADEVSPIEPNSNKTDDDSLAMQTISDDLHRLNRLSTLIRRSATRIRFEKADRTFDMHEHPSLLDNVICKLTEMVLGSEKLQERLLSEWKAREAEPDKVKNISPLESLSPQHDQHIPSAILDAWKSESLSTSQHVIHQRLLKAVLKRRHRIMVAKRHSSQLASQSRFPAAAAALNDPKQGTTATAAGFDRNKSPLERRYDVGHQSIAHVQPTILPGTSVGTRLKVGSQAPSFSTKSEASSTGAGLNFPKPAVRKGAMTFRCGICEQTTDIKEAAGERWRYAKVTTLLLRFYMG